MRADGFFTNVFSSNKYDVISFKSLFDRMSNEANYGCGLYFEIYQIKLLDALRNYSQQLNENERVLFSVYAENEGFKLDDWFYEQAVIAYQECLAEINAERE